MDLNKRTYLCHKFKPYVICIRYTKQDAQKIMKKALENNISQTTKNNITKVQDALDLSSMNTSKQHSTPNTTIPNTKPHENPLANKSNPMPTTISEQISDKPSLWGGPLHPTQFINQDENVLLKSLQEKHLVEYADASCAGGHNKGSARLTLEGLEIARQLGFIEKPVLKHPIDDCIETSKLDFDKSTIEIIKAPNTFTGIVLTPDNTVVIQTALQTHATVLKNPIDPGQPAEVVAMLTSEAGTKKGISGFPQPQNPKLGSDNFLGFPQNQYVIPVIPPLTVHAADYEIQEQADTYLKRPEVVQVLEGIVQITDKYKTVPYDPRDYNIAQLQEILDYSQTQEYEKDKSLVSDLDESKPKELSSLEEKEEVQTNDEVD